MGGHDNFISRLGSSSNWYIDNEEMKIKKKLYPKYIKHESAQYLMTFEEYKRKECPDFYECLDDYEAGAEYTNCSFKEYRKYWIEYIKPYKSFSDGGVLDSTGN